MFLVMEEYSAIKHLHYKRFSPSHKKAGLKLSIQKTKIMASGPITSWQIDAGPVKVFILGGSKITADGD